MVWPNILIAGIIFMAAALSSHISNRLYYSMHDHHPIEAGALDFISEIVTWMLQVYIIGDLLISRSPWTILYILATAIGKSIATWHDCGKHGRAAA